MKERPILFSGSMVRALLAGTKTQTRRIAKPQPISNAFGPPDPVHDIPCHCDSYPPSAMLWPDENGGMLNGDAGHPWLGVSRLWVKETHCYYNEANEIVVAYRADGWTECPAEDGKWKPSIFCTRAASRITLEITDVRAERLNSISEWDARAEGIYHREIPKAGTVYFSGIGESDGYLTAKDAYRALWESINGPGSWDASPWVWVITFKRITP